MKAQKILTSSTPIKNNVYEKRQWNEQSPWLNQNIKQIP